MTRRLKTAMTKDLMTLYSVRKCHYFCSIFVTIGSWEYWQISMNFKQFLKYLFGSVYVYTYNLRFIITSCWQCFPCNLMYSINLINFPLLFYKVRDKFSVIFQGSSGKFPVSLRLKKKKKNYNPFRNWF